MEINFQKMLVPILGLLSMVAISMAKKDKAVFCGACLAIVEEMSNAIARVDPKKTIQVGSYRIDGNGNQNLREVPYSTSDVHLSEQFDNVCGKMYNYGLAKNEDPKKKKKIFIRKYAADGTMVSSDSANFDESVTKQLQNACDEILENFEDDMMPFFKDKNAETEKKICVEELEFCTEKDVTERLWAQAQAVMAGMKEKADEAKREAEGDGEEDEGEEEDQDEDQEEEEFGEPTEEDMATPDSRETITMTDGEIPAPDDNKEEL